MEWSNETLLRAKALMVECDVLLFNGRHSSVHSLVRFRAGIRSANAVVISTPDYAHGMPGL